MSRALGDVGLHERAHVVQGERRGSWRMANPQAMRIRVGGGERLVHFGGRLWTGRVVTLCRVVAGRGMRPWVFGAVLFSTLDVLLLWGRVLDTTYLES